jgi:hypothetical protein
MSTPERILQDSLDNATGFDQEMVATSGISIAHWLTYAGEGLPPWWSKMRDQYLDKVWKGNNHLSTAVYNASAKLVGVPFVIRAKDHSIPEHVDEAEALQYALTIGSDFLKGWNSAFGKWTIDYLTQDNGAFMEIIGNGKPDGPIMGKPISIRHLDSRACTRTGDPEYPVIYEENGAMYKLHWTRVIYDSQMSSPRREMHGVGFCPISRAIDIASPLMDMIRYKQQRLGSRPHNQLLVGKGITGDQIMDALRRVESDMDSRGYTHYSRTVAIGSTDPDVGLERVDLSHMDPFDEVDSTTLGMYIIAAAFGMDADELWPTSGGSGNKSDASIKRMRSRGRLPSQVASTISQQFSFKVVPPYLQFGFNFKDDEEDQQQALVRDIRGRNRERDIGTGTINVRQARVVMLRDGDIDNPMFEEMELTDGRLPDGTPVAMLFFNDMPVYQRHLRFMEDPLVIEQYRQDEALGDSIAKIQKQRQEVMTELSRTTSRRLGDQLKNCLYALDWLEDRYAQAAGRVVPQAPLHRRTQRTDIRVNAEEMGPALAEGEEEQSRTEQREPADTAQSSLKPDDNVQSEGTV